MDGEDAIIRPASTPGSRPLSKSARSLSDPPSTAQALALALAPPDIKEQQHRPHDPEAQCERSRDDWVLLPHLPTSPRPRLLSRALTLQLPPSRVSTADTPATPPQFVPPLSPKLDTHIICTQSPTLSHSPVTSLPRHSRGLDFSRACTNLHHSTLADQSDPDSSPVIGHRALHIPARKMSMGSMVLDSPSVFNGTANMSWGQLGHERGAMGSSLGSLNMMASESESDDSDDDASMGGDDNDDPTPQVHKLHNPTVPTPFHTSTTPSGPGSWANGSHSSAAQASLMQTIRRARMHKINRYSRKSSSSASNSGYSSLESPRTTSPPPLRSIETTSTTTRTTTTTTNPNTTTTTTKTATTPGGGYFLWAHAARSRREGLAMGADGLQLSSGNESGDEASHTTASTPGVVRRPVSRRGNLLPKTKGFARIRAALAEEAAPVDTEVRREAETIKQVRERDGSSTGELELSTERPQSGTAVSSPNLLPVVPESAQEDFGCDLDGDKALGTNFAAHASRNSGGLAYWSRFDPSLRTPPPLPFARQNSSMMSDINMDSANGDCTLWRRPRARSSASDASEALQSHGTSSTTVPGGVSDDMHLKKFKRRREEDFDIAMVKRRAVSPSMSAQNSPVLTNSPSVRDLNAWGQPPERRDRRELPYESSLPTPPWQAQSHSGRLGGGGGGGSAIGITSGGIGNLVSQGKKLGLQPMTDTNQGLMNMSIE